MLGKYAKHDVLRIAEVLRLCGLQSYIGVAKNYLEFSYRSMTSEGPQAVNRLKSYAHYAQKCVAEGRFIVPRGKYRHLKPIIRAIQACYSSGRKQHIFALMTVLRVYELRTPTQKEIDQTTAEYQDSFMSPDTPTLTWNPEFPWQEFVEYMQAVSIILKRKITAANSGKSFSAPAESAIFLAKKGTARLKQGQELEFRNKYGQIRTVRPPSELGRNLPSILGAGPELLAIADNHPDVAAAMQRIGALEGKEHNFRAPSVYETLDREYPLCDRSTFKNRFDVTLRRSVTIVSSGNKIRVIGIGDYWAQYVLTPLHDTLMNTLRTIPCDYTRNHDEGFRKLSEITKSAPWIGCYDLTKATDTFPVSLQVLVLASVYGNEFGQDWYTVMCRVPFSPSGLYYKIGQPLGLRSSWAVFSLSHHLIVSFAASRVRHCTLTPWDFQEGSYGIIGDDNWTAMPDVAGEYGRLMSALGVKINMTKSHVVDHVARLSEFVKRQSLDGIEVTGISPSLILQASNGRKPHVLQRLAVLLEERYGIDPRITSTTFEKYFSGRLREWIAAGKAIPSFMGGFLSSGEHLDTEALAEPDELKVHLVTHLRAVSKYAFRGDVIDKQGKVVADHTAYYADGLPSCLSVQLKSYMRLHGQELHLKQDLLNGEILNKLLEVLELDDSLSILIEAEQLYSWISKQKLGIEFYQRSEVTDLVSRDYLHKLERTRKAISKGISITAYAAEKFSRRGPGTRSILAATDSAATAASPAITTSETVSTLPEACIIDVTSVELDSEAEQALMNEFFATSSQPSDITTKSPANGLRRMEFS